MKWREDVQNHMPTVIMNRQLSVVWSDKANHPSQIVGLIDHPKGFLNV